ncbi:hypothetical protein PMQ21_09590, partial [Bifidobacterium longum]|nr:hypothetical protein [Bifidobacterium longum]
RTVSELIIATGTGEDQSAQKLGHYRSLLPRHTKCPPQLIMRIRDGIAAQSTRILSWFATANGGNAHYCYSRFL